MNKKWSWLWMKLKPALESRLVRTQPWRTISRPIDSAVRASATVSFSGMVICYRA